jgi:general stress protein YciG
MYLARPSNEKIWFGQRRPLVHPLRIAGHLSERNHFMSTQQTGTRARGFASMSAEKQREIARKGGRAAHERGTAHEFTTDEARAAGRKGGEAVSANRSHMATIGRLGGRSSAGRRSAAANQPGQASQPESHTKPHDNGHHDGHDAANQENIAAPDAQQETQQ